MIHHFLVIETIDSTIRTDGLSLEEFQMGEEMKSIVVVGSVELFAANGAICCGSFPRYGESFHFDDAAGFVIFRRDHERALWNSFLMSKRSRGLFGRFIVSRDDFVALSR